MKIYITINTRYATILLHELPKRILYHQIHSQSHPHMISIHPHQVLPILLDSKFLFLFPQSFFYLALSFNQPPLKAIAQP